MSSPSSPSVTRASLTGPPRDPVIVSGYGPRREGARTRNPQTGLETVIGNDDRLRVPDASGDPWRRICQLDLKGPRGTFKGTGWLAGPATVITAGHCVHYPAFFGGWADEIAVAAGRSGNEFPYGTVNSTHFSTLNLWIDGQTADYDIAAIHLDQPLGHQTGMFTIREATDSDLIGRMVNISGYPTDKEMAKAQYHHANRIMAVTQRRLFYDIDTVSGQSGAPVFCSDGDDGPMICVGIHAYGVPGTPTDLHITANSAPRFDAEIAAIVQAWVRADCDRLGIGGVGS